MLGGLSGRSPTWSAPEAELVLTLRWPEPNSQDFLRGTLGLASPGMKGMAGISIRESCAFPPGGLLSRKV